MTVSGLTALGARVHEFAEVMIAELRASGVPAFEATAIVVAGLIEAAARVTLSRVPVETATFVSVVEQHFQTIRAQIVQAPRDGAKN